MQRMNKKPLSWSSMKKLSMLLALCIGLLIPACQLSERFTDHELLLDYVFRFSEKCHQRAFHDLKGDEVDYFIQASEFAANYNYLLMSTQSGKNISQLNYGTKIRGFKVLTEPKEKDRWLFVTYNDQKRTTLTGYGYEWKRTLQRVEKRFEGIERTFEEGEPRNREWYGNIEPLFIEDIDADGRLELVCRGNDSFSHNPRGLITYDFASGKIKWRFVLNTFLYSVLLGDFDGDGTKELICGNIVQKNSAQVLEGMDDANGYLMVLNPEGKLLYYEKAFDGFGSINLAAEDTNADGIKELFALSTTWGNAENPNEVSALTWTGKKLVRGKTWTLAGNSERFWDKNLLNVMDREGKKLFLLPAKNRAMVVLDEQFNELNSKFGDQVQLVWDVQDIDQDGDKEILLQTVDNRFVVLDKNLKKRAEILNPFPTDPQVNADIVKTGLGKDCRIAIYSETEVRYFAYKAVPLPARVLRTVKANLIPISLALLGLILLLILLTLHRERIFQLTIDSIQQGIIVLSSKDRITHLNSYLMRLLQDEKGKLPGKSPRYLSSLLPEVQHTLQSFRGAKAQEYSTEMPIGAKNIRHNLVFFKLHGVLRRYMILLKPEQLPAECLHDKLAWADDARRLSHNVRRHITNVLMALKPLQENGLKAEEKKLVEIIRSEIDKISVFTHAFQRFTELRDTDLKLQNVIPSVEHSLAKIVIPPNVQLIKDWTLKSVESQFEPIRFEEAFSNLINNSLEAMPEGGILHVSVKHYPLHSGPQGDLSVLIEVEDNGRGIPQKYLDEIWQLFFTTKQSGTGIGLPETKKIVESMGGTIVVESEEGKGTVVSIWLRGGMDG